MMTSPPQPGTRPGGGAPRSPPISPRVLILEMLSQHHACAYLINIALANGNAYYLGLYISRRPTWFTNGASMPLSDCCAGPPLLNCTMSFTTSGEPATASLSRRILHLGRMESRVDRSQRYALLWVGKLASGRQNSLSKRFCSNFT